MLESGPEFEALTKAKSWRIHCERSAFSGSCGLHGNCPGKSSQGFCNSKAFCDARNCKTRPQSCYWQCRKKQVETLMARGLTERKAIDVVVRGLLK